MSSCCLAIGTTRVTPAMPTARSAMTKTDFRPARRDTRRTCRREPPLAAPAAMRYTLVDCPLLHSLYSAAISTPDQPVMLRCGEQWEPLFCVIPTSMRAEIDAFWRAGERSPQRILLKLGARELQVRKDDPRPPTSTHRSFSKPAVQSWELHRSALRPMVIVTRRRNSVMQTRTLPALILALSFGILAGCANPSVITLNDGREIQTWTVRITTTSRGSMNTSSSTASRASEQGSGPHRARTLISLNVVLSASDQTARQASACLTGPARRVKNPA